MDVRYCQTCTQRWSGELENQYQAPPPCKHCGGTAFSAHPKPHRWIVWEPTRDDKVFLRVQGIDPEVESYEDDGA